MAGLRKRLFAWMLNKGEAINDRLYRSWKNHLFREIGGTVVEIGPGTGSNFKYFPPGLEWIGLEPNTFFHQGILERARNRGIKATVNNSVAEKIALRDNSADVVVCTLVLCSVKNLNEVLQEIMRVLKNNGKLIFIEHVAAPRRTGLRNVQNLFNPVNRFIADGCNCNRETWMTIQQAGFSAVSLQHEKLKGAPFVTAPHIFGYAIK